MGYLGNKLITQTLLVSVLALFLTACGSGLPTQVGSGGNVSSGGAGGGGSDDGIGETTVAKFVNGSVQSLDGGSIDLGARNPNKPRVVIFAQDTCSTCIAEHRELVAEFVSNRAIQPGNVDFITVLVGAFPEDARDFRDGLGVRWPVGIGNGAVFRQFCEVQEFPCLVNETPDNGIEFTSNGKTTIETMQGVTGQWVY